MADSVDPDFEDLFRPGTPESALHEPEVLPVLDDEAEADLEEGRLFRSQGVMAHPQAVLAIPIGSRLKSLSRTSADPDGLMSDDPYADDEGIDEVPPMAVAAPPVAAARERVVPVVSTVDSSRTPDAPRMPDPIAATSAARPSSVDAEDTGSVFGQRAIPGFAVWIIIGVLTLVAAFLNAFLSSGQLGWPTGLVLFASTIYCALIVRRSDLLLVIIAPPLVFLLAAATAGQIGVTGGGLVNRAADLFFALGDNWLWIVGSVIAAIALTVIRRSALRR